MNSSFIQTEHEKEAPNKSHIDFFRTLATFQQASINAGTQKPSPNLCVCEEMLFILIVAIFTDAMDFIQRSVLPFVWSRVWRPLFFSAAPYVKGKLFKVDVWLDGQQTNY